MRRILLVICLGLGSFAQAQEAIQSPGKPQKPATTQEQVDPGQGVAGRAGSGNSFTPVDVDPYPDLLQVITLLTNQEYAQQEITIELSHPLVDIHKLRMERIASLIAHQKDCSKK